MSFTQSLTPLARIRNIAQGLRNRHTREAPHSLPASPEIAVHPSGQGLDLLSDLDKLFPIPTPLSDDSRLAGLPPSDLSKLSAAYASCANVIKRECESAIRNCFKIVASSPEGIGLAIIPRIKRSYSEKYNSLLCHWKEMAVSAKEKNAACSNTRQSFKRDNVPILEKYFDFNAYPSRADRSMLARRTGLTLHQIDIWFQNHRARARKAQKPVRRLRSGETPPEFDLLGPDGQEDIGFTHSQVDQRESRNPPLLPSVKKPQHCAVNNNDNSFLQPKSPYQRTDTVPVSLVLPASSRKYATVLDTCPSPQVSNLPEIPEVSIFVSYNRPRFSLPEWRLPVKRNLCSKTTLKSNDIDDLCDNFTTSLNLRRNPKRSHAHTIVDEKETKSWAATRHITPPTGRHPAVVKHHTKASPSDVTQLQPNPPRLGYTSYRPVKPLPRRTLNTGFIKWQHVNATFITQPSSTPLSSTPSLPRLHRSPSTSSLESSACPTPSPSPQISSLPLIFCDNDVSPRKRLRRQDEINPRIC